jgi:hypothetical protein
MVVFDYWWEALIFGSVFAFIVIIPCLLVVLIGRKMIEQLGQYPTKTPFIQMSIFVKLVLVEIFAFSLLLVFYHFFSA